MLQMVMQQIQKGDSQGQQLSMIRLQAIEFLSDDGKNCKNKNKKKGSCKMRSKKMLIGLACLLVVHGVTLSASSGESAIEKEYKQDILSIEAVQQSLSPKLDKESFNRDPEGYMKQVFIISRDKNDLGSYEQFANKILTKWKSRNPEFYARIALKLCRPLTSGRFKDRRCQDVARKYALSALEKRDKIPLELELELIGRVMTNRGTYYRPTRPDYAQHRPKDVEVRLHAWKRLLDAIDPAWDPTEKLYINVPLPSGAIGHAGMLPKHITDPVLRAEYEAALETNQKKIERYNEQNRLHKWLKRYPKRAEEYIVRAYSEPPFNLPELKQFLETHPPDEKAKNRILEKVKKGIADYPNKPRFYKTKDKKSSSE